MKKLLFTGVSIFGYVSALLAQNVGIGINNPNRARFVVNGAVGNTTAIFGGETSGVSLQSNFPTIGFNQYYNNGHRYMAAGHAAHQFFDPTLGYMAFDIFPAGIANGTATGSKRLLALTFTGDMIVGSGTSRVAINKLPGDDGAHNAALQIKQSVESNNSGLALSDMNDVRTWKISSRNINDGILALNLNSYDVGFFNGAGDYVTFSDRRLKNNIHKLPSVLEKVLQLKPVEYTLKQNNPSGKVSIGFIAQDVQAVFPGLVDVIADTSTGVDSCKELYGVNYAGFGVLAIKAIQELKADNERLKQELEILTAGTLRAKEEQQQLMSSLQARMATLERTYLKKGRRTKTKLCVNSSSL